MIQLQVWFWPKLAGESELYLHVHLRENNVVIKIIRRKMCQKSISWTICGICYQPLSPHRLIRSMSVIVEGTLGVQSNLLIWRRPRETMWFVQDHRAGWWQAGTGTSSGPVRCFFTGRCSWAHNEVSKCLHCLFPHLLLFCFIIRYSTVSELSLVSESILYWVS